MSTKSIAHILIWNLLFIALIMIGLLCEICSARYVIFSTLVCIACSCWVEAINDDN